MQEPLGPPVDFAIGQRAFALSGPLCPWLLGRVRHALGTGEIGYPRPC